MRVSLAWIRRLLGTDRLPATPEALQQLLTLRTAEVESEIHRTGPGLDGVVVGKVLACIQHPNADRLRCCTVDVGGEAPLSIVCGAPNVAVGQTVAVATIGTKLAMKAADGTTSEITIKAGKLRGEPSQGMICAEDELGLGTSHEGILVLDDHHPAGLSLTEALGVGDQVFEIDNHGITHRPDLWGHWGWAREVATITDIALPAAPAIDFAAEAGAWSATIRDNDGCSVYCGAVVDGVHNGPSPAWMQELLQAAGVRPLGLLVDVTNYVMLELGEPMHAFDRRSLNSTSIAVRSATADEAFTTLDGRQHKLQVGDLVIADGDRPVALAGIMGGEGSMVRDDTSQVLLEAAMFRPDRIRRTRIRLGLNTDSSSRFEKGLPPEITAAAMLRAIALLKAECPNLRVVQRFIAGSTVGEQRTVTYDPALYRRYFGVDMPAEEQQRRLERLGFVAVTGGWKVPWWRHKDIHQGVDVVEEVARLTGFDSIAGEVPRLPAAVPPHNALRQGEHRSRRVLSALGWDEVATYPFASDAWATTLAWDEHTIRLANPLSAEWTVLRRSALPTLADAVGRNRKNFDRVQCYEIGKGYAVDSGPKATPDERQFVTGMYCALDDETPVYTARDAALAVIRGFGHAVEFSPLAETAPGWQRGRCLELRIGKRVVGIAGELDAAARKQAGISDRVGAFAIDLDTIIGAIAPAGPNHFQAPSRFQAVDREFTWICPENLAFADLAQATASGAKGLCRGVELVTVYRGAPYAEGEKAVSLRMILQAEDRTLGEDDLNKVQVAVTRSVQARTPARLREG